jgi:hypothetical protein
MSDDFLATLRNDWREQDSEFEAVKRRLVRARLTTHLLIVLESAWALFGIAAGCWFAWIALRTGDVLFGLSALALLLVAPPSAAALLRDRLRMLTIGSDSPEETLRGALHRLRLTDRILKIGLWNALVLVAFVAAMWLCVLAGWIPRHYPLVLLSAVWLTADATALLWFLWRRKRVAREHVQCERLLAQYEEA